MKFTQTRKAIKSIRGLRLQKDFADTITRIERSKAESKAIAHQVSHLIAMTLELRSTLPSKTRFAIADAIFVDSDEARLVGEWERKPGFECGSDNKCSKVNPDTTCYRDTNSSACVSG